VAAAYRESAIPAEVAAFFDDMGTVYGQASLVVSRAGATTLAELTALAKPAVLVPFPYAADNHQEKNGEYLVASGAARMFREDELDGEKLAGELLALLADPQQLGQMAAWAAALARREATEAIIAECLRLIESKHV
jgi:UDP-N-acetylglucosamine--N-acetylmuramyl-(pentapeptide) pyrophosphoryl-undecaprenol N-acetylglucosamine transferase